MKWPCSVGIAVSLTLQPMLTDDLPGSHLLTPEAWDALVTELLKKIAVDEKVGQLRSISVGPDNPKGAIREMIKDGQVGAIFSIVARQSTRTIQGQVAELSCLKIPLFFAYDVLYGQRMVFLINLGLASSFNPDAVKTIRRAFTYEVADDNLNITWIPMVDVLCDPRWGCVSEGFGENTYSTSIMGKVMVQVMQDESPANRYSVIISVKHFVAYSAVEDGREYNTIDMSPQRLFNDHMSPYEAGLDAGSGAVMMALNSLNGTSTTLDPWLLKGVLHDRWDFKDITVPDHGAIKELIEHGMTTDPEDAVRVAPKSEISMGTSDEYYSKYLSGLTKSGKVMVEKLDDVARYVPNVKYDMRLSNDPHSHLRSEESDLVDTNTESCLYRKEVREVARKSLVLLKNRSETLPPKKSAAIAVADSLVDSKHDVMGGWSMVGIADRFVTVLTGTKNVVGENGKVLYVKGTNVTSDKGTIDFLNQYEGAVKADPRSPQEMTDKAA